MQHTANACDLLQSKIRDGLFKNRSNTISFQNKFRNNSDFLLFAVSNTDNSYWFLIISFNIPWLKHKSFNCWIFWFSCEDRKQLTVDKWRVRFLPIFEIKSAPHTAAKARLSKSCYFDRKISVFLPYVLQICSLPAALSTGFCYQLPTAERLRIPTY